MNDLTKKRIIDVINEQLLKLHDDHATLAHYGCKEQWALKQAIDTLEETQRQITQIFGEVE